MPELLSLQRDVAACLRDPGSDARAARWLEGDTASIERRLAIYRGNSAASVDKALTAAYPVIRKVLGDRRFDGLIRAYARVTPSISGDLGDYGADLASFVGTFEDTQAMPYLPDLARLEWSVHRAYGAADASTLDPSALARVPADRQDAVRFVCAPGTALIESPYPLARIWAIHRPDFDGEFGVDWSTPETALVSRLQWQVAVTAVGAGDASFLKQILRGKNLGEATSAALVADARFDLARLLATAIASNLIHAFTFDEDI